MTLNQCWVRGQRKDWLLGCMVQVQWTQGLFSVTILSLLQSKEKGLRRSKEEYGDNH